MFKTLTAPDPTEFDGKRAIVTGGSRGIGAAVVQRLLDGGATVVTTARTLTDDVPQGATFVQGDISTPAGVQAFADAALAELGGVDIVVNNAAAARTHLAGISSIPDEEWVGALDLNYLSAVRLNNALLPALRDSGAGGVIVNISSGSALTPVPPLAHYGAAKAALNTYGKALAAELAPLGIRVATIVPGNVLTPGADVIRQNFADALGVSLDDTTAGIPLGRPGDPATSPSPSPISPRTARSGSREQAWSSTAASSRRSRACLAIPRLLRGTRHGTSPHPGQGHDAGASRPRPARTEAPHRAPARYGAESSDMP